MKRKKTYAFTLIELFVVMALMAIIVGIAIPSMSGTTRQVTLACTEISGQIELARAYAVTHNCYTAVIFPQMSELQHLLPTSAAERAQALSFAAYFNASCRTAIVEKDERNNNQYYFVMWVPDSSWKVLANGALITEQDDFGVKVRKVPVGSLRRFARGAMGTAVKEASETVDMERCIVFSRGGQLEGGDSNSMNIVLRPGSYNLATRKFTPAAANTRYSVLSINQRSGRTTVTYR